MDVCSLKTIVPISVLRSPDRWMCDFVFVVRHAINLNRAISPMGWCLASNRDQHRSGSSAECSGSCTWLNVRTWNWVASERWAAMVIENPPLASGPDPPCPNHHPIAVNLLWNYFFDFWLINCRDWYRSRWKWLCRQPNQAMHRWCLARRISPCRRASNCCCFQCNCYWIEWAMGWSIQWDETSFGIHRRIAVRDGVRVWSTTGAAVAMRLDPGHRPCHLNAVTCCQCPRISCSADFSHRWRGANRSCLEVENKNKEEIGGVNTAGTKWRFFRHSEHSNTIHYTFHSYSCSYQIYYRYLIIYLKAINRRLDVPDCPMPIKPFVMPCPPLNSARFWAALAFLNQ